MTHLLLTPSAIVAETVETASVSLVNMPGTAGAADLPPTKTIIVYRNGDAFFPGRKVVVNPRQVSTFDNLLTYLTRGIEAPFGAVRKLYTPTEGHKVQHMDDLKHGSAYVAGGNEQFKKLE